MRSLNCYYMRKCRVRAVRAAAERLPGHMKMRRVMAAVLGAVICLELLWGLGEAGQLWPRLKPLIQIREIRERIWAGDGFVSGEGGDGPVIKEGINIHLDEKAVSIFRIKESSQQMND